MKTPESMQPNSILYVENKVYDSDLADAPVPITIPSLQSRSDVYQVEYHQNVLSI
jgi:hypothetical protein